jgi:hypothetical protein
MRLLSRSAFALCLAPALLVACGGDDTVAAKSSSSAGSAGASAGGSAGASSGGASGATAGGTNAGGAAGKAGGAAGQAGSASGESGAAGNSGTAGAAGSAGGSSGAAGKAGGAGSIGTAGAAGIGVGGAAGAGGAVGPACAETCKGGVCLGEVCCVAEQVCGSACCATGAVCSFGQCLAVGGSCVDSEDCAPNELCDLSAGDPVPPGNGTCAGGTPPALGRCLPRPPSCAAGGIPGETCVEACQVKPATIPFEPVKTYEWGGQTTAPFATDVMMAPIVVQLDDDDCDGKISARDVPEIAFTTMLDGGENTAGTLHVISIVKGAVVEKWTAPGVFATKQLAGGNFDGKPGNEVVACGSDNRVRAYAGTNGKKLWTSETAIRCSQPAIADLDQDGKPEIIVEGGILAGDTGKLIKAFSPPIEGTFAVSDLDGDGKLDIVAANLAMHADGTVFADTGITGFTSAEFNKDYFASGPAVADLDKDGKPEVIAPLHIGAKVVVWQYDAASPKGAKMIRTDIPLVQCPGKANRAGGPATVGDFDNDGFPDIALAGGLGYQVYNGKKIMDAAVAVPDTLLWQKTTQDCTSLGTGSSLFDFDGDGRAEVLYSDELKLRIYDGVTGNTLYEECNTNGTLNEFPVVADVDNNGHADIVVVSNAYRPELTCGGERFSGVRVFSDPQNRWVRTRPVWNQHSYHITNVGDDGSIPAIEATNWKDPKLDNFRQNKQPGQEFAAPDAVVSLLYPVCGGVYKLTARVTNVGEAPLPAGVDVGFYLGAPGTGSLLGKGKTTVSLYPAQSEFVTIDLPTPPPGLTTGVFHVRVDDTNVPHPAWVECRTDNNTSKAASGACGKD